MSEPEPKPCANCWRPYAEHVSLLNSAGSLVLICPRNVYVPEK